MTCDLLLFSVKNSIVSNTQTDTKPAQHSNVGGEKREKKPGKNSTGQDREFRASFFALLLNDHRRRNQFKLSWTLPIIESPTDVKT